MLSDGAPDGGRRVVRVVVVAVGRALVAGGSGSACPTGRGTSAASPLPAATARTPASVREPMTKTRTGAPRLRARPLAELAVEPLRAVAHRLGEQAGAGVRPRADGEAGRAPGARAAPRSRPPAPAGRGRTSRRSKLAGGTLLEPARRSRSRPTTGRPARCARASPGRRRTGSPMAAASHLPRGRTSLRAATTLARAQLRAQHGAPPELLVLELVAARPAPSRARRTPPGKTTASRKFDAVTCSARAFTKSGASSATAHCVMPR